MEETPTVKITIPIVTVRFTDKPEYITSEKLWTMNGKLKGFLSIHKIEEIKVDGIEWGNMDVAEFEALKPWEAN